MQTLTRRPHMASAAVAILWLGWERQQSFEESDGAISVARGAIAPSTPRFRPDTTLCEARTHDSNNTVPTPSRFRRTLAALHLKALPIPRRLIPNDPAFSDTSLKRGLRQRARDEKSLRALQEQVAKAVQEKKDMAHIKSLHEQFCAIAYGRGVSPQEREDFVIVSTVL